jgi:hypothetical protein
MMGGIYFCLCGVGWENVLFLPWEEHTSFSHAKSAWDYLSLFSHGRNAPVSPVAELLGITFPFSPIGLQPWETVESHRPLYGITAQIPTPFSHGGRPMGSHGNFCSGIHQMVSTNYFPEIVSAQCAF